MKNKLLPAVALGTAFVLIFSSLLFCGGRTALEAAASAPSITLEKTSVQSGEEIVIRYSGTGARDWIGIYPDGVAPGPTPSLRWCYAENGTGQVSLPAESEVNANQPLSPGTYQIYLLQNDGYTILDRKDLTVSFDAAPYWPSISLSSGRTVRITPAEKYDASVSYELYLGTASGKLQGYTSLGTATLKNNQYTYTLGTCTVIPAEATHLYAYIKAGNTETQYFAACKISDPSFYNTPSMGNRLYGFQIFTDIHINDSVPLHATHFELALRDVLRNAPDSRAIVTIGDNTDNGLEAQWKRLNEIRASVLTDGTPAMYFAMGNHDRDYNGTYEAQVALFRNYTGMPGVYYTFEIEGNSFIVLGSERKGGFAYLSDTQLSWLRTQLEKASPDEPVFVFLHEPLKNTVSGSLAYLNPTIQDWYGVEQDEELRGILDAYPNVLLFTGHTHWHFNTTQPMLYGNGKTANYFNSASVGYLWNDADEEVIGSQGYYVEVYENGIYVRGRDFANSLWTPAAQYFIPLGQASSVTPSASPVETPALQPSVRPTRTPATAAAQATAAPQQETPAPSASPETTTNAAATGTPASPTKAYTGASARKDPTPAPSSSAPEKAKGGNSALSVIAAVLSAGAICLASAAGVLLYRSKKAGNHDV